MTDRRSPHTHVGESRASHLLEVGNAYTLHPGMLSQVFHATGEDLQEAAELWVVPAPHHLTGASDSVGPMDLSYLGDKETRTFLPPQ